MPDGVAQEAARRFDVGVKLFDEGDKRAALIEFERADAIAPNYRVRYNIAQCRLALDDYAGALEAFRRYLSEGGAEIPPARRAQVQSNIEDLHNRVGWVRIGSNLDGADISVDDTPVGKTPLQRSVLLSVGHRKMSAARAGLSNVVRYVDIAGQDTVEVELDFDQASDDAPKSDPSERIHEVGAERSGGRSLAWPMVAFGVGVVGLGVGTYFGLSALNDKTTLEGNCPNGTCPASSQGQIDNAQRDALVATVGFVVGAAGVAAGIGLLVWPTAGEHAASPHPSPGPHLSFGPGSIHVSGAF